MMMQPRSVRLVRWYYRLRPTAAGKTKGLAWRLLWRKVRNAQATFDPDAQMWTFPIVMTEHYRVMLSGGIVGIVHLALVNDQWTLGIEPINPEPPQ